MDLKMEVYSPFLELLGLSGDPRQRNFGRKNAFPPVFSIRALLRSSPAPAGPHILSGLRGRRGHRIRGTGGGVGRPYITVRAGSDRILDWYILWGRYDLNGPVAALMYQLVDSAYPPAVAGQSA